MKIFNTLRNRLKKNMVKNNRGQGATEYILLLVVVVGLVMAFKKPISDAFKGKIGDLEKGMSEVTTQ